jgi:hypothetical protein
MCTRQRGRKHSRRLAAAAMLAILIGAISPSSIAKTLDTDSLPVVLVRVDNIAMVPADMLEFAEDRAADVFRRIGAGVRWIDQDSLIREHVKPPFTVVLVNAAGNARQALLVEDTLGFADPQVHRAHVFYDRIEALTARSRRSPASILGDVMAHELGHLMLPPPGHSPDGIMRRGVDIEIGPIETFTTSQAREILFRLRQVP